VLVLGCLLGLAGCRRTVLLALPSKDAEWLSDFAARATEHQVSIEAHLQAWQGEPHDLARRATPVLVRVANSGKTPVRISRGSFELVSGTARFRTLAPEQLAGSASRIVTEALPESTLGPDESASGFVYFPRIEGTWGFMRLRTTLVDESQAVLGSVDVPFGSGHVERCSLAYVDKHQPGTSKDLLFRTCLVPF